MKEIILVFVMVVTLFSLFSIFIFSEGNFFNEFFKNENLEEENIYGDNNEDSSNLNNHIPNNQTNNENLQNQTQTNFSNDVIKFSNIQMYGGNFHGIYFKSSISFKVNLLDNLNNPINIFENEEIICKFSDKEGIIFYDAIFNKTDSSCIFKNYLDLQNPKVIFSAYIKNKQTNEMRGPFYSQTIYRYEDTTPPKVDLDIRGSSQRVILSWNSSDKQSGVKTTILQYRLKRDSSSMFSDWEEVKRVYLNNDEYSFEIYDFGLYEFRVLANDHLSNTGYSNIVSFENTASGGSSGGTTISNPILNTLIYSENSNIYTTNNIDYFFNEEIIMKILLRRNQNIDNCHFLIGGEWVESQVITFQNEKYCKINLKENDYLNIQSRIRISNRYFYSDYKSFYFDNAPPQIIDIEARKSGYEKVIISMKARDLKNLVIDSTNQNLASGIRNYILYFREIKQSQTGDWKKLYSGQGSFYTHKLNPNHGYTSIEYKFMAIDNLGHASDFSDIVRVIYPHVPEQEAFTNTPSNV